MMWRFGNVALLRVPAVALVLIFSLASAQIREHHEEPPSPAIGVQSFERSQFCRDYGCVLENVEPLRTHGEITDWFYNYRVFPKGTAPESREYPMRIGMRRMPEEGRSFPQIVIRWFPVLSPPERDFAVVSQLVREITGNSTFNTTKYLTDYAKSVKYQSGPDIEHGPSASVGTRTLHLSLTRGTDKCRYPQLTLIID